MRHFSLLLTTQTRPDSVVEDLKQGRVPAMTKGVPDSGWYLSDTRIQHWIDQEYRYERSDLSEAGGPLLSNLSSGQRKLAVFRYLLGGNAPCAVLVDPWEHLDGEARREMEQAIKERSDRMRWIFLVYRLSDLPDLTQNVYAVKGPAPYSYSSIQPDQTSSKHVDVPVVIPPPPVSAPVYTGEQLVRICNLQVSYGNRAVLCGLNWTVRRGERWLLKGPNGSGKSTLVSMIAGDNPKAYGQDITLFGKRKGQGESIWELKRLLGYFTPGQVEHFSGYQTLFQMMTSGFKDSLGLYSPPTEEEERLSLQWIRLLEMEGRKDASFRSFSKGERNLIMTLRALVKHPPLVILDEPTTGLSEEETEHYTRLVRLFCEYSGAALIWVSHEDHLEIQPDHILELRPGPRGSCAVIL